MLLALAFAAVAAAAAPSPADAAWREQRLASGNAVTVVDGPGLATNPRGDTAVAWRAGTRAYVAVRRAGAARFGRRIALERYAVPRVAVLSDGTVLVAQLRSDGTQGGRRPCCPAVFVRRLRPGARRPSPPRFVTVRGAAIESFSWSLTAGPGGRAAAIGSSGEIALVTSRRDGIFGVPASPSAGRFGGEPFVGFGGDGRGVALWVEGSNNEQRLRGVPIGRGGETGATRTYVDTPDARSAFAFSELDAGLDRRSRLTALWVDSGAGGAPAASISAATGTFGGPLAGRQVLDGGAGLGGGVNGPDLAVAQDGRAIATWRRYGAAEDVRLAIRSGAATRFRVLPALPGAGYAPRAAILSGGTAVLVAKLRGSGVTARVVEPGGRLGARRALREVPSPYGVSVAAGGGRITVAWGTTAGLHVLTYVRR